MSTLPQTPQAQATPQYEYLTGVVERLTFHSEESGYTVARLKTSQSRDLITIVGSFANIQAGQTLQLTGLWREHPQYGAQFQVTHYRETKPATITGIEKYLGSGLIKGVGPVTARRIVAHFGLQTLDIIETQIERLVEVPGIAKKRIKMIQTAWETQKAIKEVMLFLQSHGVSTTFAVKIYKQYNDAAIATVTNNPYQLATDIYGIGFITADAIARNLGIAPDSEYRYRAGIVHVLGEAAEDGHCFLPQAELVEQVVKRLSIKDHQPNSRAIAQLLVQMGMEEQLIMQGHREHEFIYYQPSFYYSEQNLASQLHHLLARPVAVDLPRVLNWIERFTQAKGIELSAQQQQAVEMAASQRVTILTGGPGTGKTFCTRTIVALWKAMGKSIVLASPTGRAAQRLSEVALMEAKTIHRLLEFDPKTMKFKRDADNHIEARAIVVDEASMLDLFLAHSLLKAIPPDAQLLLVGDIDQLPSVGPGNVLRDLIASEQIPVVRLTQVFRQAAQSYIVSNAHRINSGQYPLLESVSLNPNSDCLWLGAPEPQYGVQGIQELVTDVIPQLGFDPARDVQVLCPMTRGEVGTRHLNGVLQGLINPPSASKAEIKSGSIVLRVGDRVIQQVNDYDREVFNGDLGTITAIDLEEQEVTVQYQERRVTYDYADLNEITLAFATTIHKSQGSEYRVVILPLYMQHYMMLSRNLLYTGLTRAKQLAILVGPSKAIGLAVRQVKDAGRYTLLAQRLITQLATRF
ncbi:MAG: ATP-dependent RecD-like DNA helicase [Chroococcidiopsis cubana SAG 39.79]|uniref:ATP-dependent RecD2 DNA helicase n=1 Tax=Chroococcidiopsis cubana SAG 39.79 TaxID=388085 RepID=A0AB37UGK8_9CYAN|nr:ATP-dependent RecD-like DNA helicase [Chroococcidiopsis cubana]MDZ4876964.1 ATP-dependent RecD-like DNA helicase [Chroococcidiopsis cubana SAG 39.79]PSB58563.1 ATP-dependent RecD-like DNA helicase [Chroococcidiopsis cubana CCALA 043]RUT10712.1 ATP-dependent RecD-like DNA helicase [Chroococcidiopsis cubana SAG 39.79]